VTVPLVIIVALAIGALSGARDTGSSNSTTNPTAGALPPVSPSAPPHGTAQAAACNKVIELLPVQLGKLLPRVVHTDSPYVYAWGDPAVVLRCGVDRPKDLRPGSSAQYFANGPASGPFYDVALVHGANVWTTVDRQPYISIEVPSKYQGADILPPLSDVIAKALPAVCSTDANTPDPDKLCTRR
jgi:hypothetical protein